MRICVYRLPTSKNGAILGLTSFREAHGPQLFTYRQQNTIMQHTRMWKCEGIAFQVREVEQYTRFPSSENTSSRYNSMVSGAHQTPNT